MSRKFRITECGNPVETPFSQWNKRNYYCVNCNKVSRYADHYPECTKHEVYAIPASAEPPRRNASKRIWEIFKKQFVYVPIIGIWDYKSESYFVKNILSK